jgi:glycosyltransferase involved in cell wall biosynthesis
VPPALTGCVLDGRHARAPLPWGSAAYTRALADALAPLGVSALYGPPRAADVLWEQLLLPGRLRAQGSALVHGPNLFLPLRRPCKGVVTVHDLAFEAHPEDFRPRTRAKLRLLARRCARSAERVICVSEFTRRDVCERWGIAPERTRVVLSAPVLPLGDAPVPAADGGPYLLAVGALRAKKNLRRLVGAYTRLRAEGLEQRLLLAGPDCGEGPALQAPGVELVGAIDDARLDALMRGADALVHPSLYEGFGLAPLEAMARGVPVALARATALPEAGGDAAVYFDPLDEDDIAAAVRRVLSECALWSARGRARAARFSWAATAQATAAVYQEALSG